MHSANSHNPANHSNLKHLLFTLDHLVENFETRSNEIQEAQVLQKYYLNSLRNSSTRMEDKLTSALKKGGFWEAPGMRRTSDDRTVRSHLDPLESENNSLFRKKLSPLENQIMSKRSIEGNQRGGRMFGGEDRFRREMGFKEKSRNRGGFGRTVDHARGLSERRNDYFKRVEALGKREIQSNQQEFFKSKEIWKSGKQILYALCVFVFKAVARKFYYLS